jgi:hypothetical protein
MPRHSVRPVRWTVCRVLVLLAHILEAYLAAFCLLPCIPIYSDSDFECCHLAAESSAGVFRRFEFSRPRGGETVSSRIQHSDGEIPARGERRFRGLDRVSRAAHAMQTESCR